jgi:hypothetical protein
MKISIIVEGRTEKAFLSHLREFLKTRLTGDMPKLDVFPYDGRIPKEQKLRRRSINARNSRLLSTRSCPFAAEMSYPESFPHSDHYQRNTGHCRECPTSCIG